LGLEPPPPLLSLLTREAPKLGLEARRKPRFAEVEDPHASMAAVQMGEHEGDNALELCRQRHLERRRQKHLAAFIVLRLAGAQGETAAREVHVAPLEREDL
jgi:hypothetical protein